MFVWLYYCNLGNTLYQSSHSPCLLMITATITAQTARDIFLHLESTVIGNKIDVARKLLATRSNVFLCVTATMSQQQMLPSIGRH